ncbi:MAG: hypothetical protein H6667_14875 [Ardenticatenaceae bacterium]|nr:hypothetical protein [Ardenticatenaceae bacterium]MCB9444578.1 hypothetical protein [Ardenticatenaceae bacterium]
MKKTEQQLADELDALLTEKLASTGSASEVDADLQQEVRLASTLLELAAQTEPDPAFLSSLEAQLARASRTNSIKKKPERPSFWQTFISSVKEAFTMKRTIFALGGLAALILIGYFGWNALRPGAAPEPETIALVEATDTAVPADTTNPTTEPAAPEATPDTGSLPLLPGLSGSGGSGMGGGLPGEEPAPLAADSAATSELKFWNPLAEAEYTLNTTLPTEPTIAPVWQQSGTVLSVDDVARFAALFGMTGPVYTEIYPVYEPVPVEPTDGIPTEAPVDGLIFEPPTFYFVFDGQRTLSVYDNNLSYYDQAAAPVDGLNLLPFDQAAPLAESFLQERGLLDFAYELKTPVWDALTVEFHRVIDGRTVDTAEFSLSFNRDGQIVSLFYNPLNQAQPLGDYPLRTAEAAWQMLVEQGIDYQHSYYFTYPGEGFVQPAPEPLPFEETYRYWPRTYQDGAAITLYSNPLVYQPVNSDAAPRIQADQFILSGSDEMLRAIANEVGQQVRFSGIVRGSQPGAQTIELTDWERIEYIDYQYRTGTIRVQDGQTVLETEEGETILIPDAPADLADGEKVNVNGWAIEANEAGNPIFNWLGIDIFIDWEAVEPLPIDPAVDPAVIDPYQIKQVTINSVDMIYTLNAIFEEGRSAARLLLQPAWRFQGTTDTNEGITFIVQAVADEFLAPMPSPVE